MADTREQLREHGCLLMDLKVIDILPDSAAILSGWFEHRTEQQKLTVRPTADAAADSGRGYFEMPSKEVLEVKESWKCPSAPAELRLAANTAYRALRKAAHETLHSIFSSSAIMSGTTQQLQQLLGQKSSASQTAGDNQQQNSSSDTDRSSVLHINRYKPSPAAAAAASDFLLQGTEAHIDKGLLTVIWATQPGLQLLSRDGSWLPVTAGPNQLVILVGHTLSFLTAGRLPAAMHRVVVKPSDGSAETAPTARLSLCFKLHAAPEAVLSPASVKPETTGELPRRFQVSKTVKQLMEEFDTSHTSIHSQRSHMQQHNLQPTAPAAAVPVKREPSSSPEHAAKRPCQQPVQSSAHSKTRCIPQPQKKADKLRLIFRNQRGQDVDFTLSPNIQLCRLFEAYTQKMQDIPQGVHSTTHMPLDHYSDYKPGYRFIFDGEVPKPYLTPMHYGMEDGDIIDVVQEQLGD